MKSKTSISLFLLGILLALNLAGMAQAPATFTVTTPGKNTQVPTIVLQYDPAAQTGYNWEALKSINSDDRTERNVMSLAVKYLVEGVQRMTGRTLPVISSNNLSNGIVLTVLKNAPADIRNDPEVIKALANTGKDAYNANEAYFIRSEKNRLLIVANQWDGLSEGIVDLLETAGYVRLNRGRSPIIG